MKRKKAAQESMVEKAREGEPTGLEIASTDSQPKIGTLSFPVRGEPLCEPIHDNTDVIAEIIKMRRPDLLLCAGWSVPCERNLEAIGAETRRLKTILVVETTNPTPVYYRVSRGLTTRMGGQFFSERIDMENETGPRGLADALPMRSFSFNRWNALLLNCGEVMVVRGRKNVEFHWLVPRALQDAVRAPTVMILNPTHTRMGNCGTIKAWRKFLSSGKRVYVSASNWDVANGQRPSDTLHSVWHNGKAASPVYCFGGDRLCYREWNVPHWADTIAISRSRSDQCRSTSAKSYS
jgi:hypothetical protein